MSFERDRDSYTRGVGAIAASDHLPAARRRKFLRARVTQARDRKLRGITFGPRGGLALGKSMEEKGSGGGQAGTLPGGGPGGGGGSGGGGGTVLIPPRQMLVAGPGVRQMYVAPPVRGVNVDGVRGIAPGKNISVTPSPLVVVDPGPIDTTGGVSAGGGGGGYTGGGSSGGGKGGGGGGGGAGYTAPPVTPPTFQPGADLTESPPGDQVAVPSKTPWPWIIVAGIGAILFLRGRGDD